jgi:hypothetical protein
MVTASIALDLFLPERRVGLGPRGVKGTPVPEASIDVHSYPGAWEHHVGSPPKIGKGTVVYPIS